MPFCPKCKSEYVEGKTKCVDCDELLVESLSELIEDQDIADETTNYPAVDMTDESFSQDNDKNNTESIDNNADEKTEVKRVYAFKSSKEKYKEYIETGIMFTAFSIIGIIFCVLNQLKVINVFRTSTFFYIVIYGMFAIFFYIGINSFVKSKSILALVDDENMLIDKIKKEIEIFNLSYINNSDTADEEKYFEYSNALKEHIYNTIGEVDNSLIEQLVDEAYDEQS